MEDFNKHNLLGLNARRAVILCCGKLRCSQTGVKNSGANSSLRTANIYPLRERTISTELTKDRIKLAASTISVLTDGSQDQAGGTGGGRGGGGGTGASGTGASGTGAGGTGTGTGESGSGAEKAGAIGDGAGGTDVAGTSAGETGAGGTSGAASINPETSIFG